MEMHLVVCIMNEFTIHTTKCFSMNGHKKRMLNSLYKTFLIKSALDIKVSRLVSVHEAELLF